MKEKGTQIRFFLFAAVALILAYAYSQRDQQGPASTVKKQNTPIAQPEGASTSNGANPSSGSETGGTEAGKTNPVPTPEIQPGALSEEAVTELKLKDYTAYLRYQNTLQNGASAAKSAEERKAEAQERIKDRVLKLEAQPNEKSVTK